MAYGGIMERLVLYKKAHLILLRLGVGLRSSGSHGFKPVNGEGWLWGHP